MERTDLRSAAGVLDQLSAERLMEHTADIARWVRLSGTPDERKAFDYVKGVLDDLGLETELIEHDAYISLPGNAAVEVTSPVEESVACITHSMAAAAPEGVEGEVVYAGAGTAEDLAAIDVAGKVALVEGLAMPAKVRAIEDRGAIAQMHINADHLHEMIVSTVWGNPTPENVGRLPQTPVVSILGRDGARLKRYADDGRTSVRIRTEVDTGWRKIPLLEADLRSAASEDFVMFSGHIDSWHYGAMDNATANAAMIEITRALLATRSELMRGLRLLFWSGHSHGRYAGSAWYADTHWEELHNHCVAHVNIDSIGGRGATMLGHGIIMPETKPLASAAIKELTGQDFEGSRCGRAGDQSFWGTGVPSMFMSLSEQQLGGGGDTEAAFALLLGGKAKTGGLGWWWHTPHDTIDKIDGDLLLRDTRVYATVIHNLVTDRLLPFDYAGTARELRATLEDLHAAVGTRFDLTAAVERVRALEAEASRLGDRMVEIRERAHRGADETERANECIKALGRLLVPLNYTKSGPFDHDPAMAVPPIPTLNAVRDLTRLEATSDEAKLLETRMLRARNYVQHTLAQAIVTLTRFLSER